MKRYRTNYNRRAYASKEHRYNDFDPIAEIKYL